MYQGTKLLCRFERQTPSFYVGMLPLHQTGSAFCCRNPVVVPYLVPKVGLEPTRSHEPKRTRTACAITALCPFSLLRYMYQGTKKSFALPTELYAKLMACIIGVEPIT